MNKVEIKKFKLGDVSNNIQTGPFGSQLHQSDYTEDGTPVIMPKDFANGIISIDSIERVSEEHVNRLKQHKVKAGDIIIVDIINESVYNTRFNGGCFGGRLWQTKSCILTTSNA